MAKHDVTFTIPWRDLGRSDVEFEVKKDGKALGKLEISKGAAVWFSRDDTYGYKLSWTKFDKLMMKNGRRGPEKR